MTHPDEGPETAETVEAARRVMTATLAVTLTNEAALDRLLRARGIPCTDYPAPEAHDVRL